MSLTPGTRLGPYEILAPIGAGGMGEVFRARDTRLGRDVALKVLTDKVSSDPFRRQRFEQEARAVAALNHPNIVAVYDVGDGYMISELVDGETLYGARLSLRKTLDVAVQIASALAAAHAAGIVHRDLKPGNIILTRDGRAKILDFGLARMHQPHAVESDDTVTVQTTPGLVVGTVGYMSPEQVRGLEVDHRSDIFSFGVILHELLSGKRTFRAETSVETLTAILRDDPPDLPETVPAPLRQIVAHCLEKDAKDRFQSAGDLRFALWSIAQSGSPSASGSTQARRSPWARRALAGRLRMLMFVAAGSALLTGAAFYLMRPARPAGAITAIAVPMTTSAHGISTTRLAIFISCASIFLPRYSGVRPTISPAMNTATMAKASMPYRPEPTPPKITSPSCISHIGTMPPSGVNESCIALTEPFDAAVVAVAHNVELTMPKRVSLPSMLPPACTADAV